MMKARPMVGFFLYQTLIPFEYISSLNPHLFSENCEASKDENRLNSD